jgi:hypothetical protein
MNEVGGHSAGATPDPIPNSEVKPGNADGTTRVTAWESRTPPELIHSSKPRLLRRRGFFIDKNIAVRYGQKLY